MHPPLPDRRLRRALLSVLLASAAHAPADTMLRGPIRVPAINTPHPRLFLTPPGIEAARARIASGRAPWLTASQTLQQRMDDILAAEREPHPYTGEASHRFYYSTVWRRQRPGDATVARDMALAYTFSGDNRYAEGAIRILLAWATADPPPGSRMDAGRTANGEPLTGGVSSSVARGLIPFAYAYDLLYGHPSLTNAQRTAVETWFRATIPQIRRGIDLWDEHNYFNRQEYQNHVVAHMAGLTVIGYAVGDRDLVQFALDHPDNPRDFHEIVKGTIFMAGDEPHHREGWYTAQPTQTGEIYDRYRHYTARGGIPRGLQYAHLSLKLLTVAAETAFHNGLDLYRYVARSGETLRLPYEFYADFYRTGDATIKGGFYAGESRRMAKAGDRIGLFEIGFARYPDSVPLRRLIQTVDRTAPDHDSLLFGPTVLTHGQPVE